MAAATPEPVHRSPREESPAKLAGPLAASRGSARGRHRQISIVLTGGPCSGKSSMMALLRDRLARRGIQVITVPEYATHFFSNSDGFQPEWVATEKENDLQNVLLRYQMMQEDLFRDYAELNSKTTVLLLDRGCLDQKVFVSSDDIFQSAMDRNGVDEQQLLARYDMVIHLATCALVGSYEWGPGSNNPGRYHCPEEAARLDGVFCDVYKGHRQFRSVPHCEKFAHKVDQVMKYLEDALGVDGLVGARQRTSVAVHGIPEEILKGARAFATSTTYIDESKQLSVRRTLETTTAAWQCGLADGSDAFELLAGEKAGFHQRFEERRSIPEDMALARRGIPEGMYHNAVTLAKHPSVQKHSLGFQDEDGLYHELFYFQGGPRTLILDHPKGQRLPSWCQTLETLEKKPVVSPRRRRMLKAHSTEEESESLLRRMGSLGIPALAQAF